MSKMIPWTHRTDDLFGAMSREMDRARRELDHYFVRRFPQANGETWFNPPLNVAETDAAYEVTLDVPGMQASDFNIELKDGAVWITGERKYDTSTEGKTWHRVERFHGQFRRVIRPSTEVDGDRIEAHYQDGVLRLVLPKVAEALPRRIEVKT